MNISTTLATPSTFHGVQRCQLARFARAECAESFRQPFAGESLRPALTEAEFPALLRRIVYDVYADSPDPIAIADAFELVWSLTDQRMPDPDSAIICGDHEKQIIAIRQRLRQNAPTGVAARTSIALEQLHAIQWYIRSYRQAQGVFHKGRPGFVNHFRGRNASARRAYPKPPVESVRAAFSLWHRIRNELYRELTEPIRVDDDEDGRTVEVMDFLRYDCRYEARTLSVRVLQPDGSWADSDAEFAIDCPLITDDWIRVFLNRWFTDVAKLSDGGVQDATLSLRNWLSECVRLEMAWNGLMPALRAAIKACFPLDGRIAGMARRLRLPGSPAPTYNTQYVKVWRYAEMWERVFDETPRLAAVLNLAIEARVLHPECRGDPIHELKNCLRKLGITQRGWGLLACYGRKLYWPSVVAGRGPEYKFDSMIAHLNLVQACAVDALPTLAFQRMIYLDRSVLDVKKIPPRLFAMASNQFDKSLKRGMQIEFVVEQWLPVASWFARCSPKLNKAQWRGGWLTILRLCRRSVDEREMANEACEWIFPLAYFEEADLEAHGIRSHAALILESEVMVNCVSDYPAECDMNWCRFFSIRDRHTGARLATMQVSHEDEGWRMTQVKRVANQRAGWRLTQFAHRVAAAFDATARTSPIEECQPSEPLAKS